MTSRTIRRTRTPDAAQNQDEGYVLDPIASMARGLAQAQSGGGNTMQQDIIGMLTQIAQQLSQLQEASQANQQGSGQNQTVSANAQTAPFQTGQSGNTQQNQQLSAQANGQQPNPADELQKLFSQLLQTGQQNSQQQGQPAASSGQGQEPGGSSNQQNKKLAVKTAAQVLSEAQFELSVELENSLQKLKQVISESEKLADKISKLLGEESTTQKS